MTSTVATCPHCERGLTAGEAASINGQANAARRVRPAGPPKQLAPCRYCSKKMGARERRAHEPRCPSRRRES